MNTYVFNVMLSVEVEADNLDQAKEILNGGAGGNVKDREITLIDEREVK